MHSCMEYSWRHHLMTIRGKERKKKKATDKSTEKTKEPSTAESEEKSYEQQTLFPSTNMY